MNSIDGLLRPYAFGELIDLAITIFGLPSLFVAAAGFLGLAGYLVGAPFRGVLWNTRPRVIVFGFVQQLVYVLSFLLLITSVGSLLQFLLYYLPVFVATGLNSRLLPKLQSYGSMIALRKAGIIIAGSYNLLGIALVWAVLGLELYGLAIYNPTLPMISWLLLIYAYLMSLLQAALSQGVLFQIQNSPFVKITTNDGKEFEGFITGKGSDNYVLVASKAEMVIQSDYVKYMVEQQLPGTPGKRRVGQKSESPPRETTPFQP